MTTMKSFTRPMLAAAICAAAACSTIEEHPCTERMAELSISVGVEQPTKAIITDSRLPDDAEICIALFGTDGGNYNGRDYNHAYFFSEVGQDGQVWKTQTHSKIFLGESEAVIYAYYPYDRYTTTDIRAVKVTTNNYYQDDFMFAGPYTGHNVDNRHVNITMKHGLAAIRLTTRRGSYTGAGAVRSIGIGGDCGATSGVFDVTQGKYTSVSIGGTIYPTTNFNLNDGTNTQYILLIPPGEPGTLTLTMNIDDYSYEVSLPDVLLEMGKITDLEVDVDMGKINIKSVTVTEWYRTDRGTVSAPADYRVVLDGNQEGISIGTVISTDKSVTITAVPYISKEAKVKPVTFEGDATFSQRMNEKTGVRTIVIQELKSHVRVTFDGYSL